MSQGRFVKFNETSMDTGSGWVLCFQYGRYEYGDGGEQNGYRFIWRKPTTGNLQSRGQARIPSVAIALRLMSNALEEGWGCHNTDAVAAAPAVIAIDEEIEEEVE